MPKNTEEKRYIHPIKTRNRENDSLESGRKRKRTKNRAQQKKL